ncbi:MAG: hypothetical protein WCP74_13795 [Sphingobacteriia bacterium]
MRIIFLTLLIAVGIGTTSNCNAQDLPSVNRKKKHKYSLYMGVGPNYYFNNLVLAKDYVRELNYSFVTRFMWEPEFFVSLGFETGYNKLYTVKGDPANTNGAKIVNASIPIQFIISMKFLKDFYGNFTMGQGIRLNKITTNASGDYHASNFSLGDYGIAVGYQKIIAPHFSLGTELKGYYSSKLDDRNMALVFMAGYRF